MKAAIVGCGRIGAEFDLDIKRKYVSTHAGAYAAVDQVELVAVCDIDAKKAVRCARRWGIPYTYKRLKDMLSRHRIDLLSICTPPETHYQVLRESIRYRPKGIFCEKPIAHNLKAAQEMIALCKRQNVILQINHQRRFDPLHHAIRQTIQNGRYGQLQQGNFYYTAGIYNTGSHMFDLIRYLFGDIAWIQAVSSKRNSGKKSDPNIDGMLKLKNGAMVSFQACDVSHFLFFELNAVFEKGRVVIKNSGFDCEVYDVKPSRLFSGYRELFPSNRKYQTKYRRNFMVNGVKTLIKATQNGHRTISSGLDGYRALQLIMAGLKSAKNDGKRVDLNYKDTKS